MHPRLLPSLLLVPLLAAAASASHPVIGGRGPADLHGVIPLEVAVEKEPVGGQEFTVQARVAPGSFPDLTGCPVYAWVVEPAPAGKRAREERLKPVSKNEKTRRVRQRPDGSYWTTEGVRFRLEPHHAGKRLRIQVRPSKGGQLNREQMFFIARG